MDKLPLNDPRWRQLNHRNWSNGKPSKYAPDAPFVPDELSHLLKDPADIKRFSKLWPCLCSEDTAWPAAFAAVPYAIELAQRSSRPDQRFEYLYFVGYVIMCSFPDYNAMEPHLRSGFQQALTLALPLLAETLLVPHDATHTRYLLAATAALKGHPELAEVLNNLDCISAECPKCGQVVYPQGLHDVLR